MTPNIMKKLFLIGILFLGFNTHVNAQYEADVESIDSIIKALYASISGEAGVERDWDRFRNLFIEDAKLMPTGLTPEGKAMYRSWGIEEYVSRVGDYFKENGFIEAELSKVVEQYRYVAHVFSTYESRRTAEGEVIARGINSIQLFYDNERWWIVSVFWSGESEEFPIPDEYLDGQ